MCAVSGSGSKGDVLASAPLFAGLADDALDDLRMAAVPFAAAAGTMLFRQGDEADGIYLIARGRIAIAARTPGDDEVAVIEAGPGSLMGELCLLDGGKRSATARVLEDASGLFIRLARFRALAAIGRPAAFALLERIRNEVVKRFRATISEIESYQGLDPASLRCLGAGTMPAPTRADGLAPMLRGLARFAHFSAAEAEALVCIATRVDAPRGTVLARAGARAEALHIVLRGAVRPGVARRDGFEALAVHGPGEFAGLAATIDGGPIPLTIETAEPCILLRIEAGRLDTVRGSGSDMAHSLFDPIDRQLVRDLRRANRHLARAEGLKRFSAGAQG